MLHCSMSEHWRPDDDLAAAKGRRRRPKLPPGGGAALTLLAVLCLALGSGVYQVLGPRDIVAEVAAAR